MAGGELSPRQKMINMMYLVLMALLALNVSAEILDAFQNLKVKLQASASNANDQNSGFASAMQEEINKEITEQKISRNKGLIDSINLVREKTQAMIGLIDKHIQVMDSVAAFDPETGEYKKKGERERNHLYFLGTEEESNNMRGNGQAAALRDSIDAYANWIADMYNHLQRANIKKKGDSVKYEAPLLKDPAKGVDGHSNKTWEKYTFDGPVVANLAILEALKFDIYRQEKDLFDIMNTRLGVATFKIDKVIAVDAPRSEVVTAGLQFETRLYVAMSSSQAKPTFSSGSGKITTLPDGGATLKMGASGGVIPKGKREGKQKYSATISVPKATGGFERLAVNGEFTVRKPEIVITSTAVQNLYRACANTVKIDVPALGNLYNPVINASGAQVVKSQKSKTNFVLVPSGKQCVVTVSSNTNGQTLKIGDVTYKVISPPKPSVEMRVNGKATSGSTPVSKASKITVQVKPDPEFKSLLPKDARYKINGIEVLAQLSLGPPRSVNKVRGGDATKPIRVSLGPKVKQARPGTKVYIRIDAISRVNFKGQAIPDKRFSEVERMLSIVVK